MSNQLYRSSYSKKPSWASSLNKRTNRTSKDTSSECIDVTSNDDFPELSNIPNQTISNNEITSSFLKTIENTERKIHDKQTTNENTNFSTEDGWIEITKDTYKHMKTTEQIRKNQTLKKTKDPFIHRLLSKDMYIHSLNDEQYAMLADKTMNKVIDIYKKQANEFIDIYGPAYYDQIYGYVPVYGTRVVKILKSDSYEDNDMTSLTGVYNEYYTDEDETYNDEDHQEYDEDFEEY